MSDLEIFELGVQLAKMLNGDKEAIADIKILYERHPEMFKNIQEVIDTINEVVKEPEIIMQNPQYIDDNELLAAKRLDSEKMGDVVIKNDDGTNIIFHANKKRMRDFKRLEKMVDGGDAHSLHTAGQAYTGANVTSSVISSTTKNKTIVGEAVRSLHTSRPAELGGNDKSSGAKAHSTIAKKIIANNTKESNIKQKIGEFFKQNKDKSNKDIDR